ncbi:MAG: hypothetical protein HGB12_11205 [Bacteroidetes bacterium]|nr:hypothetical protein [Bacteroidota bacterium]
MKKVNRISEYNKAKNQYCGTTLLRFILCGFDGRRIELFKTKSLLILFFGVMTFNLISFSSHAQTVQVLAVGGGGGGAFGGGGGGGYQYNSSFAVTSQAYTVIVGEGGSGKNGWDVNGVNGTNSVFSTITAYGGGGGAKYPNAGYTGNGVDGGCGGGGSCQHNEGTFTGGAGSQGYNGGTNGGYRGIDNPVAQGVAGGGGGAGAVGGNATSTSVAGNGGNGLSNSISGTSVYYAGGGGGCVYEVGTPGTGGNGGGGNGGHTTLDGTSGTANTGGGGGGGGNGQLGGNGGSGIVIIAYPTGALSATGGTITTSGGNTIHTFTSSGTFNVLPAPATVDWNKSNVQEITLTANRSFTFTNGKSGGVYSLLVKQNSTGGYTVTWPASIKWIGVTAPTLNTGANATALIKFLYDGTNYLENGIFQY